LTKESDRLPALSGLVKAGLSMSEVERFTGSYIAPPWSWLSHRSGNRLLFQGRWLSKVSEGLDFVLKPIAQVLDITAEPAGLDPTGTLKSGRLFL
jgi:hypothetical protein